MPGKLTGTELVALAALVQVDAARRAAWVQYAAARGEGPVSDPNATSPAEDAILEELRARGILP